MFTQIPDAYAILVSRGIYRQAAVFERGTRLYARYGSGFILLRRNGGTSVTTIMWDELIGWAGEGYSIGSTGALIAPQERKVA